MGTATRKAKAIGNARFTGFVVCAMLATNSGEPDAEDRDRDGAGEGQRADLIEAQRRADRDQQRAEVSMRCAFRLRFGGGCHGKHDRHGERRQRAESADRLRAAKTWKGCASVTVLSQISFSSGDSNP